MNREYRKRRLQELNLMDNFLFFEMVNHPIYGEPFTQLLLKIILGREVGKLKVIPQKEYYPPDTDMHGARLDVYLDEEELETLFEKEGEPGTIYDLEPDQTGGRKPWRQKGTGHARQGSTRSPQWTGGGVVFAPTPRDYSFKLNKKEKRAALKSALTSRVVENKFVVVDELKLDEIKTKKFVEVLKNLNVEKALVILNDMDEKVIASAANIPTVKTTQTNELNVFDVLKYDTVVVTKAAVATIEEVYA